MTQTHLISLFRLWAAHCRKIQLKKGEVHQGILQQFNSRSHPCGHPPPDLQLYLLTLYLFRRLQISLQQLRIAQLLTVAAKTS